MTEAIWWGISLIVFGGWCFSLGVAIEREEGRAWKGHIKRQRKAWTAIIPIKQAPYVTGLKETHILAEDAKGETAFVHRDFVRIKR